MARWWATPVAFVNKLGTKIEHVHWKDMPAELESSRGSVFGAGMATIPLGTGSVDIAGTVKALKESGFDGYTTLEVAGDEALQESVKFLRFARRGVRRREKRTAAGDAALVENRTVYPLKLRWR